MRGPKPGGHHGGPGGHMPPHHGGGHMPPPPPHHGGGHMPSPPNRYGRYGGGCLGCCMYVFGAMALLVMGIALIF